MVMQSDIQSPKFKREIIDSRGIIHCHVCLPSLGGGSRTTTLLQLVPVLERHLVIVIYGCFPK
jgi:phosphopantothenate synthetase